MGDLGVHGSPSFGDVNWINPVLELLVSYE